jgi:hypothetical protein
MAELPHDTGPQVLDDQAFELLVLYADGELSRDPVRRAEAEALVARDATAAAVLADLQTAKQTLHAWVVGPQAASAVEADLSMLRGRVMTRLPQEASRPVAEAPALSGLWAWLRGLGFGKASLAMGAAALAAVVLVVVQTRRPAPPVSVATAVAHHDSPPSTAAADEPTVIIEEMDVEGSVTVTPGLQPSQPTVIWHFQPGREGEG